MEAKHFLKQAEQNFEDSKYPEVLQFYIIIKKGIIISSKIFLRSFRKIRW